MLQYIKNSGTATGGDSTTIVITGGDVGMVQVTDITTSTGIVSSKQYLTNTVPINKILTSAITDTPMVSVHFIAEPASTQSPSVTVNGIQCTNLQQYSDDRRLFFGSVNISVTTSSDILVLSSTGKQTIVHIDRAELAPVIQSAIFVNGYPNSQNEVKNNDIVSIRVTFDPNGSIPTYIQVDDYGISKSKTIDLSTTELNQGSVHTATFTITTDYIGNVAQLLPARMRARNTFGTYSANYLTNASGTVDGINVIKGCDLIPSFVIGTTTYPTSQSAFKDVEVGSIDVTVNNYTTINYTSPNDNFTIDSPTVYSKIKQITCTNQNIYNDSVNNITLTATRAENGTSNSTSFIVEVADISPVIHVYHNEQSLRSSVAGINYVIHADSNQKLANAPDINIPVSGNWVGSGFTGSDKIWTRPITITDINVKGTGSQSLLNIPTNKAGLPATVTGSQIVRGFVSRQLNVDPFDTTAYLSTAITNIGSVNFTQSFKTPMAFSPIGTQPPVVSGQTIDAIETNPTNIIILDTQACNASSQTSTISIEELS